MRAYRPKPDALNQRMTFDVRKADTGIPFRIPCGQCIGCRIERARQWTVRCMHEKRMHDASAFLTLTYADANLPVGGTLRKRDLQLFMKRLRKERPQGLRFFACGEYGEQTRRPHYHLLLFNTSFPDMRRWSGYGSQTLFASAELDGLWKNGAALIGEVTDASCAYVARYITKKITGDAAAAYYGKREPEFALMSRRPGIGLPYLLSFGRECYRHDNCVVDGVEVPLPRYYDTKCPELFPDVEIEEIKKRRKLRALAKRDDNTFERRRVREQFTYAKRAFFRKGDAL